MNNYKRKIAVILALAGLYFLFGKFAFTFAISYKTVTSAIFLSEGIALAFILLFGKEVWPGIFAGQLILSLTGELSIYTSFIISAGNSIEALAGLWILKKMKFNTDIDSLKDYMLLVIVIFAFLQPLSAGIGITSLYIFENVRGIDLLNGFIYWWIGNSMGQLLITPVIISAAGVLRTGNTDITGKVSAAAVTAFITGSVSSLIFLFWGSISALQNIHSFFMLLPVVIFLSLMYEFTGAVTSGIVISMIAQIFTVTGYGPFSGSHIQSNLISLNIFIISITLSAGFTGILFHERKQRELKLKLALNEIKELRGILPICSSCKKIRNDQGAWQQIETYIEEHSDAEFSHSLCDDCYKQLYGKETWFKEKAEKG